MFSSNNLYCSQTEQLLKDYIQSQLKDMAINIKRKSVANFQKRKNNPFHCFNDNFSNTMGLGRSIDSQLGNRLQKIAFFLARLKFGKENVPNFIFLQINPYNINTSVLHVKTFSMDSEISTRQVVICEHSIREMNVYNFTGRLKTPEEVYRQGIVYNDLHFSVNSDILKNILRVFSERDKNQTGIPVDLAFYFTLASTFFSFELKSGGNLDTKNAEANALEVESLKTLFSFYPNNESFFATCYDSNGEGKPDGSILGKLDRDRILIGREFWEMILPQDITYERFIEIYQAAFYDIGVEEKILG